MTSYKVGIVGCGNIFPMHAQSIITREDAKLVAVCDVKKDRADAKAAIYNCASYTDYEEMFNSEQLDVIHICLPHHLHAPVAIAAAKRKIHVLTEKPMSIAFDDAREMVETAKENDTTLGVIFQNRYNPGSQLIKNMLVNGELGAIKSGKLSVTWDRSDEYYLKSDWKGTWEKEGGGVIIDQAIHTLDLMRWFVDSDIKYVDATISNRAHEIIEVEDSAEGVISFQNGVVSAFHAINYYTYDAPVEIELHCEQGIAKMVADRATVRLMDGREFIADNNPQETFHYDNGAKGYWGVSHVKQINNFYESLKSGAAPDVTGEDALKTQKMICAIYESGKKRERVTFHENAQEEMA
ncbi:gfo/Idh/MocA family oxidoreductase [Niallia circulans]|uniref:Gfo/Idh/MocA family oxidoreductase n=1 Tax=Niallia circulans TaxID=1397 RepID=A0A553SPQ4_NIACI|nr:Gfo/Idh/MocA family oxidoreductase [Niallia circulans]TRZ38971.1 gfo/Idh/MocA family oxidoreductase [Niallia circulans]